MNAHAGKSDAAACERVMRDMQKAGLEPDDCTWLRRDMRAGRGGLRSESMTVSLNRCMAGQSLKIITNDDALCL
jgi:pentatricopeptide repeat protein